MNWIADAQRLASLPRYFDPCDWVGVPFFDASGEWFEFVKFHRIMQIKSEGGYPDIRDPRALGVLIAIADRLDIEGCVTIVTMGSKGRFYAEITTKKRSQVGYGPSRAEAVLQAIRKATTEATP